MNFIVLFFSRTSTWTRNGVLHRQRVLFTCIWASLRHGLSGGKCLLFISTAISRRIIRYWDRGKENCFIVDLQLALAEWIFLPHIGRHLHIMSSPLHSLARQQFDRHVRPQCARAALPVHGWGPQAVPSRNAQREAQVSQLSN